MTLVAILTAPIGLSARLNDPPTNAVSLARKALDAMGGEQKFRNLETVRFKAIGQRNMLEQSERPEGPYFVEYEEISEARDFKTNSLRPDDVYLEAEQREEERRKQGLPPRLGIIPHEAIAAEETRLDAEQGRKKRRGRKPRK